MPKLATKLTDKRLRSMKPGAWLADSEVPGLGARRHRKATTFVFRYLRGGKRHAQVIGEWSTFQALSNAPADGIEIRPRYEAQETIERVQAGEDPDALLEVVQAGGTPLLTLDEAREVARELRKRLKRGESPKEDPKADFRQITLGEAFDLYLARKGDRLAPRTAAGYRSTVRLYLDDWKARTLLSLKGQEVEQRHREIGKAHGQYAANAAMRILRAVFRDMRRIHPELAVNPVDAVSWFDESGRHDPVPVEALPGWWRELKAVGNDVRRDCYAFLLFSGLRSEDARSIRIAEIDFEQRTLHRPNPKGGARKAFTIPLSRVLMALIRRRMRLNAERLERTNAWRARKGLDPLEPSPWLFPNNQWSGPISQLRPEDDGFSASFKPHGLRSNYTSAASAAGVDYFAQKMLTNHALPANDITARYIRPNVEALRRAQEQIAAELFRQIHPERRASAKVVRLRRAVQPARLSA